MRYVREQWPRFHTLDSTQIASQIISVEGLRRPTAVIGTQIQLMHVCYGPGVVMARMRR